MGLTGLAALLRYWPWAVGVIASIALAYFGWVVSEWRHGYLEREQAKAAQARAEENLEAERIDRLAVDAARLKVGVDLSRTIDSINTHYAQVVREKTIRIPSDAPCLPVEAVRALNEGR